MKFLILIIVGLLSLTEMASAFYDANLGRWLNRDPIEESDGANLYLFVYNAPTVYFDDNGLQASIAHPGGAAIAADAEAAALGYKSVAEMLAAERAAATAAAAAAAEAQRCKKERCDKEWKEAREKCQEELTKPNPSRGITGGYKNIEDCARGLVSEECGGNPVKPKPKRPPRRWFFGTSK